MIIRIVNRNSSAYNIQLPILEKPIAVLDAVVNQLQRDLRELTGKQGNLLGDKLAYIWRGADCNFGERERVC